MTLFLDSAEIAELTHRKQRRAQVMILNALGIHYKVRPDGSIAILRAHVEKEFGGGDVSRKKKAEEPNWGAINAKTAQS